MDRLLQSVNMQPVIITHSEVIGVLIQIIQLLLIYLITLQIVFLLLKTLFI